MINSIKNSVSEESRQQPNRRSSSNNAGRLWSLKKFLVGILIFNVSSCAVFDRRNTILVNAVEEHMVPETQPSRLLLAPIYIPVGLMAGVLDAFVVHPVRMIPEALKDTDDALWEFSDESGYVTHAGSIVYRGAFSPVFFAAVWLARSAFIGLDGAETEAPADRPEGSYEDFLRTGNKPGLIYDLENCSVEAPSTALLVKTYQAFSAELSDADLGDGYGNPGFRAVLCLMERKDEQSFQFFKARLTDSNDGQLRWIHNNAINYFRLKDSERAARVLLEALNVPGHSLELNMSILRGLMYMQDEGAQRLILRSIQRSGG